jgi:tetratricopeptide (TPR) repeat protein
MSARLQQQEVPSITQGKFAEAVRRYQAGQLKEAESLYRQILTVDPDHANTLHLLGVVAFELGRPGEAAALMGRALTLAPSDAPYRAEVHNNLGVALQAVGRLEEALAVHQRALELVPGYASGHLNYGNVLMKLGRFEEALCAYRTAIALRSDHAAAHFAHGNALLQLQRFVEAHDAYRDALKLNPESAEAHNNLGIALSKLRRSHEAVTAYRRALELKSDYAEARYNLGGALSDLGLSEDALAAYEAAAGLRKHRFAEPLANKALLLIEAGQLDQSRESIDQALAVNPDSALVWQLRSQTKFFAPGDPDIETLEALNASAETRRISLEDRIRLEFALGKVWMDVGDAERAFKHLDRANRLKRSTFDYDAAATDRWLALIAECFTFPLMQGSGGQGHPSEMPVFIVGMPRSGTTLVEQILASHPEIHGAGELEALPELVHSLPTGYPQVISELPPGELARLGREYERRVCALGPVRRRVVDKMPSNFCHAGLIHLILPQARIIHCHRNAADTCLSCYTKEFRGDIRFAYDQRELGLFYRGYESLMAHWRKLLPPECLIEVEYEDVVSDLEVQARRLVAFCGLDWSEACLNFQDTPRQVKTLSAAQVREPIYRSSVGRWRPFAPHMGPLLATLGFDSCAPLA